MYLDMMTSIKNLEYTAVSLPLTGQIKSSIDSFSNRTYFKNEKILDILIIGYYICVFKSLHTYYVVFVLKTINFLTNYNTMQSMKELTKSLFMAITLFAGLGLFVTSCSDEDETPPETEDTCETEDSTISPDINYTWATDTEDAVADAFFDGFGEYSAERVENPDKTGNESCYVMKVTRGTNCEVWGGAGQELGGRVDFSEHSGIIKLDVWGDATDVTLVFENNPFPENEPLVAKTVNMTKSNEWETLTFDFSDDASGNTYGNLILYITRNVGGCMDEVYYVDNLVQG